TGDAVWAPEDYKAVLEAMHARGRGAPAFGVKGRNGSGGIERDITLTGLAGRDVDCIHDLAPVPAGRTVLCNVHREGHGWIAVCHNRSSNILEGYERSYPEDRTNVPLFRLPKLAPGGGPATVTLTTVVDLADVDTGDAVWAPEDYKAVLEAMHARGRGAPAFGVKKVPPGSGIRDFKLTGLAGATGRDIDCRVFVHATPSPTSTLLCNLQWDGPREWIGIYHDRQHSGLVGYAIGSSIPWDFGNINLEEILLFEMSGESTKVVDLGDVPRSGPLDRIEMATLLRAMHRRSPGEGAFHVKTHSRESKGEPDLEITGLGPAALYAVFKYERLLQQGDTPLFKVFNVHLGRWHAVVAGPDVAGRTPLYVLDYRMSEAVPGLRFLLTGPGTAVHPYRDRGSSASDTTIAGEES
ncbi:hypothetical protein ABIA35_006606, partial [Catenulispora sp. MAP12-49]|uniref:hypothetical protein n=1 Tax=Catenulispora sp. MAP12-49 TaxID=3156302 RepID=UPI003513C7DD